MGGIRTLRQCQNPHNCAFLANPNAWAGSRE
jgi:hypothetical protein